MSYIPIASAGGTSLFQTFISGTLSLGHYTSISERFLVRGLLRSDKGLRPHGGIIDTYNAQSYRGYAIKSRKSKNGQILVGLKCVALIGQIRIPKVSEFDNFKNLLDSLDQIVFSIMVVPKYTAELRNAIDYWRKFGGGSLACEHC